MRRFTPKKEPAGFKKDVTERGNDWLAKHPDSKASEYPGYWNKYSLAVQDAFDECCAYMGFPISSGEVDHFIAKSVAPDRTYQWLNYRFAEGRVNRLKKAKTFLDPFEAEAGWLDIDPITLEYSIGPNLPTAMQAIAKDMVAVLNDRQLIRGRQAMFRSYRSADGNWDLNILRILFPLLADAAERLQKALAESAADQPREPVT